MKILLQRVRDAQVCENGETLGKIDQGLLLLIGFGKADYPEAPEMISRACDKILNLRVFSNDKGRLDYSVLDRGGDILAVPQFTLYGSCDKGRRPDFTRALAPDSASRAYNTFVDTLSAGLGRAVATGRFGADMQVSLTNDGPFTLMLEF